MTDVLLVVAVAARCRRYQPFYFCTLPVKMSITIGVLALQGAFREHVSAFTELGSCRSVEVRTPSELAACDGLVLPGGESTAIALIAQRTGMVRNLLLHSCSSTTPEESSLHIVSPPPPTLGSGSPCSSG